MWEKRILKRQILNCGELKEHNMNHVNWVSRCFCLLVMLGLLLSFFGREATASETESQQYYKMVSTVEYSGKGQFRNAVETLLSVQKELLPDNKVKYSLSAKDYDLGGSGAASPGLISFVVDPTTKQISDADKDLVLFEKVTNECVNALKVSPQQNIGKTWSQSFSLPFLGKSFPKELKFTLTAIKIKNKELGEMVAVRALSEPFPVKTMRADGKSGTIDSRINSVYLFDSQISEVYLSASVFAASTNISGLKEQLRHEIATYETDSNGKPLITGKLGSDFEKLIQKIGLTSKGLAIKKKASLPSWACFEGLRTSQVSSICAATACEGASNPVASIYMPAIRTISMQSSGVLASTGAIGTVGSSLANSLPAVSGMKIAAAPAFAGAGLGTTGTVAAAAAAGGGIAVANDSDDNHRSP